MSENAAAKHALIDALFAAFERNDADAIAACFEANATISKNGEPCRRVADALPEFATLRERIGAHRYTDVRRTLFDGGFVEEHRVETVLPSGQPYQVTACVVGSFGRAGRIAELREYVDTGKRPQPAGGLTDVRGADA